jgi:hypothetical protein
LNEDVSEGAQPCSFVPHRHAHGSRGAAGLAAAADAVSLRLVSVPCGSVSRPGFSGAKGVKVRGTDTRSRARQRGQIWLAGTRMALKPLPHRSHLNIWSQLVLLIFRSAHRGPEVRRRRKILNRPFRLCKPDWCEFSSILHLERSRCPPLPIRGWRTPEDLPCGPVSRRESPVWRVAPLSHDSPANDPTCYYPQLGRLVLRRHDARQRRQLVEDDPEPDGGRFAFLIRLDQRVAKSRGAPGVAHAGREAGDGT